MKNGKNKVKVKANNKVSENNEVKKLIQITVVIILVFVIFYAITKFVTDENMKNVKEPDEVEIQFNEIILGDLLKQKESEYYVLVTFDSDKYVPLYNSYFAEYNKKDNHITKYNANVNNIFNQKYISETSNFVMADLKFKESTLLKVKNDKIVETYEGRKNIIEHLSKLID